MLEEYKDTHRTEKTGFIFKDIHHWTEREYFKVANVVDVTHNLHQYIHDIEHLLAEEIEKARHEARRLEPPERVEDSHSERRAANEDHIGEKRLDEPDRQEQAGRVL